MNDLDEKQLKYIELATEIYNDEDKGRDWEEVFRIWRRFTPKEQAELRTFFNKINRLQAD